MMWVWLVLSLLVNVLLGYMFYQSLKRLIFVSENIEDMSAMLEKYTKYVEDLHELEMYYGDEMIAQLLEYSKHIADEIESFRKSYDFEAPIALSVIEGEERMDAEKEF